MNYKIICWAIATQKHEGWFTPSLLRPFGSRSYKNNNPGNLKLGDFTKDSQGIKGTDKQNFIIFDTYSNGFLGLCQFFENACAGKYSPRYNPEGTLVDFYSQYNPVSDGGNPWNYAKFISLHSGLSITDPIKNYL